MYSPETVERIRQLRARDAEGTLTIEDMKEAARLIRAGRMNASQVKAAARAKGPLKSGDAMLDELDSM